MKAANKIFILSFVFLSACGASQQPKQETIVVDETLTMGPNAVILNPGLASHELGIIASPNQGKIQVALDRLIVEPVDDFGLSNLLGEYQVQTVDDLAVLLMPNRVFDQSGLQILPPTEKILQLLELNGNEGYFDSLASQNQYLLPVTVSNQKTQDFLNFVSRIQINDSKKFTNLRAAIYAVEPANQGLNQIFSLDEWATCRCLERDADNQLEMRSGATWNDEIREAPVYNALIEDRSTNSFCTYNDGVESDGSFKLQGNNVLIVNFSTIYDNRENNFSRLAQTGPEGNMHLWAFPTKVLPLHLPGVLDRSIPVGGMDLILRGPSDKCEWWPPDFDQYIAYQNFILWEWSRSDPPNQVGLLVWEGDECMDFLLFKICNPDDLVSGFVLDRAPTYQQNSLLIRDIDANRSGVQVFDLDDTRGLDLQLKTIDFCRNNGPEISEVCNGYDDTCDGEIDEGYPKGQACDNGGLGQCATQGTLICNSTLEQSNGGPPVICNAPGRQPSPFEICDGIDNDCDGQVDEDWLQKGLACGLGIGTCGVGAIGCDNGHISCDGEIAPTAEICDGLDNDCDGVTDEGCPCIPGETRECSINLGPCTKGIQSCDTGGQWSAGCSGTVPQPEVCDGIDNNCNSTVDEGVLNRCGTCGLEPLEICDGFDNDCDGEIDEGVTNSCGGCWTEGPEICDGLDNDCDGAIDETDSPIVCGSGVCSVTIDSVCDTCTPLAPPVAKEDIDTTCTNGLDDDCDGLTDVEDWMDCLQAQGGGGH